MAAALIPPEVRARLRELRLTARSGAGGAGLGQHASRSRGAGLEFAQYRAYEPGDEPRRIDWKLYARSDRYFVREAERDSPLTVWLLLDATASMRQADTARPAWAKLDAAKALAACVIELALRQGDRFALITLGGRMPPTDVRPRSGRGEDHRPGRWWGEGESALADSVTPGGAAPLAIPAGAGPRQRDRCLLALASLAPAGSWPDAAALAPIWERIAPNALVLLLSDFFDEPAVALAERLADARREVLGVQLLGADERDFPFRGGHRLREPESGAERIVDADAARRDFLARFAAARAELARRFAVRGIRHAVHVLDEPLDAPLRALFGSAAGTRLNPSPPGRGAGVRVRAERGDQPPADAPFGAADPPSPAAAAQPNPDPNPPPSTGSGQALEGEGFKS